MNSDYVLLLIPIVLISIPLWDIYKCMKQRKGEEIYKVIDLNGEAEIKEVKVSTTGFSNNKYFRIRVVFSDGYTFIKTVKPAKTELVFATTQYTLLPEQKKEIVDEAIFNHKFTTSKVKYIGDLSKQRSNNISNNALNKTTKTNNNITNISRNILEQQLSYLCQNVEMNTCLEIYNDCYELYSLQGKKYFETIESVEYLYKTHVSLNNIKKIAVLAFIAVTGRCVNFDNTEDREFFYEMYRTLEKTANDLNANKKNAFKINEESGLTADNPIFFKNAADAEIYLNTLYSEDGRKLHVDGLRLFKSNSNIPGMIDVYSLYDENGSLYGELNVSIYGKENYNSVPKGYSRIRNDSYERNSSNHYNEQRDYSKTEFKKITSNNLSNNLKGNKGGFSDIDICKNNYCRKCGKKLIPDSKYCRFCGAKVE